MKTNTRILRELADRMKANSNGSLLFFQNAGVTISGEYPTMKDLNNLYQTNYEEYKKLIKFLYADELKQGTANADGTTQQTNADKGWELANTALTTTGNVLSSIFGNRMGGVQQQPTPEVEEKKDNTVLYIVIGFVALILIGGGIYYFKKR